MKSKNEEILISVLEEITLGIAESFDIDTICQKVIEQCVAISHASRGSLFLYDSVSNELVMRAEVNSNGLRFIARYLMPDNNDADQNQKIGLATFAYINQTTVYINSNEDIKSHKSHLGKYVDNSYDESDCNAILCVPLVTKNKKNIGVIKIENTIEKKINYKFNYSTKNNLERISRFSANAIDKFNNKDIAINESINSILANGLKLSGSESIHDSLSNTLEIYRRISNSSNVSIWLIDGTHLRCVSSVGSLSEKLKNHEYINSEKKSNIGLIPCIAYLHQRLNIKHFQRIKSHPQYSEELDSIWNPENNQECCAFLGEPLKQREEVIGAIVATKIFNNKNYFTTSESHIFSYLSIIASIIIDSKKQHKKTISYEKQLVSLYELGTKCHELEDPKDILWYLLVGLTNSEGIGLNRVSLFQYIEDNNAYIKGVSGLGPVDRAEADKLQEMFDSGTKFDINWCIGENSNRNSLLSSLVKKQNLVLSKNCALYTYIKNVKNKEIYPCQKILFKNCCKTIQEFLRRIDIHYEHFYIFSLFDDDKCYLGICDNMYINHVFIDETKSLYKTVDIFIYEVAFALNRLTLKKSKEESEVNALCKATGLVTHKIGTEISISEGSLKLLKHDIRQLNLLNQHNFRRINSIEKSLNRLKQSAKHYSALNKLSNSESTIFCVNKLLDRAINEINEIISNSETSINIKINTKLQDHHVDVYGNEYGLLYAFEEVLHNAAKAMPEGGTIEIHSEKSTDEKKCTISIVDTGYGIKPNIEDKIYDLGFKDREGGQGFGLYVVKKLIENHGGAIYCKNNINKGVTFLIQLVLK